MVILVRFMHGLCFGLLLQGERYCIWVIWKHQYILYSSSCLMLLFSMPTQNTQSPSIISSHSAAAGQFTQAFSTAKTHSAHCWTVSNLQTQMMKVRLTWDVMNKLWTWLKTDDHFKKENNKCISKWSIYFTCSSSFTFLCYFSQFYDYDKSCLWCSNNPEKVHKYKKK